MPGLWRTTLMFIPSTQQSDFFTELRTGHDNILLSACAGSGKTTTIIEGLKTLPVRNVESFLPPATTFLAFNKSIAETLKARCPSHVSCSTFHSLGMRALKTSGMIDNRTKVEGRKMSKLLYNLIGDSVDIKDAIRLASIARSTTTAPQAMMESGILQELTRRYDFVFDSPSEVFRAVAKSIQTASADLTQIDFDEMLYLPVILGAQFEKQDYVFVDEAQDTNDIQLEILARLAKPKQLFDTLDPTYFQERSPTRYIFVGDPHQAIYAFRGANADSMQKISERFQCKEMPLSVSFRCPQSVVAEAQKFLNMK